MKKSLTASLIFFTNFLLIAQTFPGVSEIKRDDLINTVRVLSSPDFDGRLAGSEGYNKAAEFAANKFLELGLKPAGDEKYFQYFNIEYNKIISPANFKTIVNGDSAGCQLGKDFVMRGFTGSNKFTLPVAFCGYGISRPDIGYDDYAGIDVKNKIVLVFKQNPGWKIEDKDWGTSLPREKSLVARKFGARGILFVSLPNDKNPQSLIGSVLHGDGEQPVDFPQLHISIDVANNLLSRTGLTLGDYQNFIDKEKKPKSVETETQAFIEVNAEYTKVARTMNVVGMIEGSDPLLKNEYLIIGAHLDHVGSQAGLLFPGANDNASGSASVLEIAAAFAKAEVKPRRSVIFVLFAGEEQGLDGSKYFVNNFNMSEHKIAAMINLDCVGYGDSIQVGNGKSAPKLWSIAKKIDSAHSNYMIENTWSGGGADATPFYEKGIPCLYFVTKNSYEYLHLPGDKVETLNAGLFENIVKLAYMTASSIADGEYKGE